MLEKIKKIFKHLFSLKSWWFAEVFIIALQIYNIVTPIPSPIWLLPQLMSLGTPPPSSVCLLVRHIKFSNCKLYLLFAASLPLWFRDINICRLYTTNVLRLLTPAPIASHIPLFTFPSISFFLFLSFSFL